MERTTNAGVVRARELRRAMSPPEHVLWQALRTRPAGLKFRRQHPLGLKRTSIVPPPDRLLRSTEMPMTWATIRRATIVTTGRWRHKASASCGFNAAEVHGPPPRGTRGGGKEAPTNR